MKIISYGKQRLSENTYLQGWLMSFIAVACFSCKAILVKLIYQAAPISAISTISLRMLGALPVFIFLSYRSWRPIQKHEVKFILAAGFLGYYAASFLDFLCLKYISTALERLVLFLNPSIVLLLSYLFFKQKINYKQAYAMAGAYLSILLIFSQEAIGGENIALGMFLAFLSAVCYALYLIVCSASVKKIGAMRLTSLATIVASIFCLIHFLIQTYFNNFNNFNNINNELIFKTLQNWPLEVYIYSFLNSTACTIIPIFLTILAVERCSANIVAQTSILGPCLTIILGVIFLNEPFGIYHLIGTIGTVISVIFLNKFRNKN